MKVKRLSSTAVIPCKAYPSDLGYDLFADENTMIGPHETKLISTGIAIQFPNNYGGLVWDRSSIATKKHLQVVAGAIDPEYRGEIKIALYNADPTFVREIHIGDKIAQLILIETTWFVPEEVHSFTENTSRGGNGFGSSGAHAGIAGEVPWTHFASNVPEQLELFN